MILFPENDAEFNQMITTFDRVKYICFTSAWCGPCKKIFPIFEKLLSDDEADVAIKVDVDKCPETTSLYEIQGLPTFVRTSDNEKALGANVDNLKLLMGIRQE